MPINRRQTFLGSAGAANYAGSGENFRSLGGTLGHNWTTNQPDEFDYTSDEDGFYPVSRLRQQYVDYLSTKVLEYEEQKVARHYYHGAQWSPEEIRILRTRRQPVITFNRTNRKIDGIVGLVQRLRQDPKAYPRNPSASAGADLVTQSIRAVLDGMDFEYLDFECTKQCAIEGIGGIELKLVEGDHADPDISGDFVFGDDFFYDPRSYKPDFSDARYMGIAKWLDVEAAVELFPDKEAELRTLMVDTGFDLTTHSDREFKWVYVNEQRLRLVEHWYLYKGQWYWAFYCSWILLAQGVSPFIDERNKPMNRFIMFSCMVDHDGDRYGFPRNLKGPQDELNQRRSKSLHLANTRRLILEKGAVDDTERARIEWARPDGVIEKNPGKEVIADDIQADFQAQLALMQDARQEIDGFANIDPQLMTQADANSGVAINMLQKAGIAELGSFIKYYRNWKLRVYRAVWSMIKTTWKSERWLRVNSGNQSAMQIIQLNGMAMDQHGRPAWLNRIGGIAADIVLDEGPDTANLLIDALDQFKQMPPGTVPPQVLLKLMPLPEVLRNELMQMMSQPPPPPPPDPKAQAQLQIAQIKAQTDQQRGIAEVQRAQQQTQSDAIFAHADIQAKQQEMAIQRQKGAIELQKAQMDIRQTAMEHGLKMREMAAQTYHKDEQRKIALKQQKAKPKGKAA